MRTEIVLEMLVSSPLNQLTQLVAREYFIIQCRHESYKSYMNMFVTYTSPLAPPPGGRGFVGGGGGGWDG
jgi:uncharacterized membrane protein